jgi:hypothetical protein
MKIIILFLLTLQINAQEMVLKPAEQYSDNHNIKTTLELDVFGLSYHTNRDYDFNEKNPGLGLSAIFMEVGPETGYDLSLAMSTGIYKDSYSKQALYFLAGPRVTLGYDDSFHASISVQAGYLDGSGKNGLAAIPFVTIGYDWFNVGITGELFSKSETVQVSENKAVAYTKMVAVFLKFKILDF